VHYATKLKPKAWAKVHAELEQLKTAPAPVAAGDAGDSSRRGTAEELGLRQDSVQ